MRLVFSLLPLFVFSFVSAAQRMPSRNYTVNDGLPSNTVRAILKDSKGEMWIGTGAGFCRFDGKSFTVIELADQNRTTT